MGRLRDEQLKIWVTQTEKAMIKDRMRTCDYTDMSRYIRDMAIDGYIINIDRQELKDLTLQISKIGNNINQIAHHANATGIVFQSDLDTVKMEMNRIWQLLRLNL